MTDQTFQFLMIVFGALVAPSMIYAAKSLGELNTKIAIIIERVDSHERRLSKLEKEE